MQYLIFGMYGQVSLYNDLNEQIALECIAALVVLIAKNHWNKE